MRILAIDAGNSRIKWGVHEDGSWRAQGWVPTQRASRLVRAWAGFERPDAVIAVFHDWKDFGRLLETNAPNVLKHVKDVIETV